MFYRRWRTHPDPIPSALLPRASPISAPAPAGSPSASPTRRPSTPARNRGRPTGHLGDDVGRRQAAQDTDYPANYCERERLQQELAQDVEPPSPERKSNSDFPGSLGHAHQHDVHDADAAYGQRHARHGSEQQGQGRGGGLLCRSGEWNTNVMALLPMPPARKWAQYRPETPCIPASRYWHRRHRA